MVPEHHPDFKAAWEACDPGTVAKHLDVDASEMLMVLEVYDKLGVWDREEVPCHGGDFQLGRYSSWREWRNRAYPGAAI